jgi:aminoglycoside phosphotransferase (APT) family kinase protein
MVTETLMRLDRLAPALSEAMNDGRWDDAEGVLIAGGKSNLTFELTSAAGQLILRRPPSGDLAPSAHDMGRETRVQRALGPTSVPVAKIILEDKTSDLIGAPFYVMEKVHGHIIRGTLPAQYADTAKEKAGLAFALVNVLADLHAVNYEQVGLGTFGRPNGFLQRQINLWTNQWDASPKNGSQALDSLASALKKKIPENPRHTIVHGDFRLDNCLMNLTDPTQISAVLDWEMSTIGDPLTDLGLFLFYWRQSGEPESAITPTVTTMLGFPSRGELSAHYAERAKVQIKDLAFYEAFAHFKFAVIANGIAHRVAAGSMAGQDFGDLTGEIIRTAEDGLSRLNQNG